MGARQRTLGSPAKRMFASRGLPLHAARVRLSPARTWATRRRRRKQPRAGADGPAASRTLLRRCRRFRRLSPMARAVGPPAASGRRVAAEHQRNEGGFFGARADRNRGGRRVAGDGTPMSEREAFDAILASLHENGARPCALVERHRAHRRRPRHARQQHGVRRRRLRRRDPDRLCVVVRPRTTGPGTGAGILPDLLPPGRTGPARAASPRQPSVPYHQPLHREGTQDLRGVQRAAAPRPRLQQHQRAPGRAGWLADRLGRQRPGRRERLVVRPARL